MSFDYSAPAELFLAKRTKNGRNNYRRFTTAAEAIRYAIEDLRTPKAFGAWLEVGDELSYLSLVGFSDGPCDAEILTAWLAAEPKSRPYS